MSPMSKNTIIGTYDNFTLAIESIYVQPMRDIILCSLYCLLFQLNFILFESIYRFERSNISLSFSETPFYSFVM